MASLEYRENEMGGQRDDTLDKLERQGWTGWIPPPIGVVPVVFLIIVADLEKLADLFHIG